MHFLYKWGNVTCVFKQNVRFPKLFEFCEILFTIVHYKHVFCAHISKLNMQYIGLLHEEIPTVLLVE